MKNNAAAQETCRKLIEAAGFVFAERGLHAATIKQITDRAGVNTAAINYHFSDKFELYAAVIRYALSMTPPVPSADQRSGSPEERLREFVAELLRDLYDSSRPPWRSTLLAHEFAQPTAALDAVMDDLIRPRSDWVLSIIRDILGPAATQDQVARAGLSIGGQCFIYLYNAEVVRRLHPGLVHERHSDELIDHITEFSLAALREMRKQSAQA